MPPTPAETHGQVSNTERTSTPEASRPPSPALMLHLAHGEFGPDAAGKIKGQNIPEKVNPKAYEAIRAHHDNQRDIDAAVRKNRIDTEIAKPEGKRHLAEVKAKVGEDQKAIDHFLQMEHWSSVMNIITSMALQRAGDQQPQLLAIFKDKLDISIDPQYINSPFYLQRQFFDETTGRDSPFYNNICKGDMAKNLTEKLSLDEIDQLRNFLTPLMGGPDSFLALKALKAAEGAVGTPAGRQQLEQAKNNVQLAAGEDAILDVFRKGTKLAEDKKNGKTTTQTPNPTSQVPTPSSHPESRPTPSAQQSNESLTNALSSEQQRKIADTKREIFERAGNRNIGEHMQLQQDVIRVLNEERTRGKGKIGATIEETKNGPHGKEVIRDGYVVYLPPTPGERIITVGDIHGDLATVRQILDREGFIENMESGNPSLRIVFQGDLVDRGPKSVEVMEAIMQLKIRYGDRIQIIAADHDTTSDTVSSHDFPNKLKQKFGKGAGADVYGMYSQVFGSMPKMIVAGNGLVVVHGGLPGVRSLNLAQIARLEDTDKDGLIAEQLSWGDPIAHPAPTLEQRTREVLQGFENILQWTTTQPQLTDESYVRMKTQVGERAFKVGDLKTAVAMMKNLPPGVYPNPARSGTGLYFDAIFAGLIQYDQQAFDTFLNNIGGKVMMRGHQTSDDVDGGQPNLFEDRLWTVHSTGTGSPESAYRGRESDPKYGLFVADLPLDKIDGQKNIQRVWGTQRPTVIANIARNWQPERPRHSQSERINRGTIRTQNAIPLPNQQQSM